MNASMPQRTLGRDGPAVSALGLGCVGMSWMYGQRDDAESIATLHRAVDLGVTLFDTAEVYGPYRNESLLGEAFAGMRDQVFIATKFGFAISPEGKIAGRDSRPASIRAAVEGSLQRLRSDHIDLLYQHMRDTAVPMADVVGTMAQLVQEGKVRFLGLSNINADTLREACAIHPIAALQSEYSLWERRLEAEILPAARALGVALVAYSPLGRGFLTGEATRAGDYAPGDYRRTAPRFQAEHYDHNMDLLEGVRVVADRRGATLAQVALAWLLAQGDDIVPIPGTKRRRYLEENLGAATLALTAEDLEALDLALPPGAAAGAAYTDAEAGAIDL